MKLNIARGPVAGVLGLVVGCLALVGAPATVRADAWEDSMRAADWAMQQRQLTTAEQHFQAAIAAAKTPELDEQRFATSLDRLAAFYHAQGQYAEAAKRFGGNFKTYGPDATKAPDSLLKLGLSLGALGETDQACRTLNEVARVYPTGPASVVQAAQRERQRLACS